MARGPGCRGARGAFAKPPAVKRRPPLWFAVAFPAMALGHIAGYGLSGATLADGRHAWLAPALELCATALTGLAALVLVRALLRAGIFAPSKIESSVVALAPRLAVSQLVLFAAAETFEGRAITPAGIATQLASALLAAYALSLFTKLVERCIASAEEAGRYLERLTAAPATFALVEPAPRAAALFATAGTSRFQRPPPFA